MKLKIFGALMAAAIALPSFATNAYAYEKCADLTDSDLAKCEKKEAKRIEKLRKTTVAFTPSTLAPEFASLDASNPFDTDDWYLGVSETGIEKVDELVTEVVKVQAAVKMAKWVSWEYNNGDKAKATELATPTLNALMALKDSQSAIMEKVDAVKATPPAELVSDPSMVLKVPGALKALGTVATQIPTVFGDMPGAITSIKPIAAGVGGDAVESAMDAAGGAMP